MIGRIDRAPGRHKSLAAAALVCAALFAQHAAAITTSQGQAWGVEPDAWTRGNNANSSHFGWDVMETTGKPFFGALRVLDDATPDIGGATTATGTRLYQGANGIADTSPTINGHLSGSLNYYTFNDVANDTITATAPASGAGGYTTVVLQVIASLDPEGGFNRLEDLTFTMDDSTHDWTLDKHLHATGANKTGLHWVEWWAAGANPTFKINIASTEPHRGVDAFQIDTYWTPGDAPALNAIQAIPEPTSWLLALGAILSVSGTVRGRSR